MAVPRMDRAQMPPCLCLLLQGATVATAATAATAAVVVVVVVVDERQRRRAVWGNSVNHHPAVHRILELY